MKINYSCNSSLSLILVIFLVLVEGNDNNNYNNYNNNQRYYDNLDNPNYNSSARDIQNLRRAAGFPVRFYDGEEEHEIEEEEDPAIPPPPLPPHPFQYKDEPSMEDMEEEEFDHMGQSRPEVGGEGGAEGAAAAAVAAGGDPAVKQDENPLNFLQLTGTDFQPGRMVNIFFGLMIMVFMIVIHGYILWIVGIAYLPGTRSFEGGDFNWGGVDPVDVLNLVDSVLDAVQYWKERQRMLK